MNNDRVKNMSLKKYRSFVLVSICLIWFLPAQSRSVNDELTCIPVTPQPHTDSIWITTISDSDLTMKTGDYESVYELKQSFESAYQNTRHVNETTITTRLTIIEMPLSNLLQIQKMSASIKRGVLTWVSKMDFACRSGIHTKEQVRSEFLKLETWIAEQKQNKQGKEDVYN
jgi:hypothetical protein